MKNPLIALTFTSFVVFAQPPQRQELSSSSFLMHRAALRGETKAIEMMIKLGADVNVTDDQGKTPLHDACLKGHSDTVRFLLDHGANIGACDKSGATPLHDAALGGKPALIKLLLERGADKTARDTDGLTALDYAKKMDRVDAARVLKAVSGPPQHQ